MLWPKRVALPFDVPSAELSVTSYQSNVTYGVCCLCNGSRCSSCDLTLRFNWNGSLKNITDSGSLRCGESILASVLNANVNRTWIFWHFLIFSDNNVYLSHIILLLLCYFTSFWFIFACVYWFTYIFIFPSIRESSLHAPKPTYLRYKAIRQTSFIKIRHSIVWLLYFWYFSSLCHCSCSCC